MYTIQGFKINIRFIHEVDRVGYGSKCAKNIAIVVFAVGNQDKRWNVAS